MLAKENHSQEQTTWRQDLIRKKADAEAHISELSIIIQQLSNLKGSYERDLQEIQRELNDLTLYVQEEVERMVSETLEYIKENSKKIATNPNREFTFPFETKIVKGSYNVAFAPTGNISVFGIKQVTSTKYFTFTDPLYILRKDNYEYVYCEITGWFYYYYHYFVNAFLKELKRKYNCAAFNLTIGDSSFILELA